MKTCPIAYLNRKLWAICVKVMFVPPWGIYEPRQSINQQKDKTAAAERNQGRASALHRPGQRNAAATRTKTHRRHSLASVYSCKLF